MFHANVVYNERIIGFNICQKLPKDIKKPVGNSRLLQLQVHQFLLSFVLPCSPFIGTWNAQITFLCLACHYGLGELKFYYGNKWRPTNGTSKGYLLWACCSTGVNDCHLLIWETQKQAEKWECFIVEKREDFRSPLIGGCWHRKPEVG